MKLQKPIQSKLQKPLTNDKTPKIGEIKKPKPRKAGDRFTKEKP